MQGLQVEQALQVEVGTGSAGSTERREAASSTADGVNPSAVIRGVECQATVGVDWVRFVGDEQRRVEVERWLTSAVGAPEPGPGGMWFYGQRHDYKGGVKVLYSPRGGGEHFAVEVPGKFLAVLSGVERVQVVDRFLSFGLRCTRVDVAVDFFDRPSLVGQVRAACEAGELCRARRYRVIEDRGSRGTFNGRTVYLGQRGKDGSGRFVRVYDKGLETGRRKMGEWVRWEVEFSDSVAQEVVAGLVQAMRAAPAVPVLFRGLWGWEVAAYEYALGAVEFRTGPDEAHLERRDHCGWYADLVSGCAPRRVVAVARGPVDLEAWARWIRKAVLPSARAIAAQTGMNVGDFLAFLGDTVEPGEGRYIAPVVWEAMMLWGVFGKTVRGRLVA